MDLAYWNGPSCHIRDQLAADRYREPTGAGTGVNESWDRGYIPYCSIAAVTELLGDLIVSLFCLVCFRSVAPVRSL